MRVFDEVLLAVIVVPSLALVDWMLFASRFWEKQTAHTLTIGTLWILAGTQKYCRNLYSCIGLFVCRGLPSRNAHLVRTTREESIRLKNFVPSDPRGMRYCEPCSLRALVFVILVVSLVVHPVGLALKLRCWFHRLFELLFKQWLPGFP